VIRLGDLVLNDTDDGAVTVNLLPERFILHPNYNAVSNANDIALIKLKKRVTFTSIQYFLKPLTAPLEQAFIK
jgi:hypothetical protein